MEPFFQVIVEVVASHYSLSPALILSRDQHGSPRAARSLAMHLSRRAGFSFPEIGDAFGRDHTTVMSSCKRVAARCGEEPRFQALVDQLFARVSVLESPGPSVKIRQALFDKLASRLELGIYGKTVEDMVDRILCEHFQHESGRA